LAQVAQAELGVQQKEAQAGLHLAWLLQLVSAEDEVVLDRLLAYHQVVAVEMAAQAVVQEIWDFLFMVLA
jgi:hypothetical protein